MTGAAGSVVVLALVVSVLVPASAASAASTTSPVDKVVQMLANLETKITYEAMTAQKEFESYSQWCRVQGETLGLEVKHGKQHVEQLEALIEKDESQVTVCITHVEESTASIHTYEKETKELTTIRDREKDDFAAEEKELIDLINTLERAIAILEREQSKHDGASMLQTGLQQASTLAEALKVMVEASAINTADATKLTSLLQSSQESDDSDDDMDVGAPAAAVYKFASGGIIDVLEGLLEKAKDQLKDAREKEQGAMHSFNILTLSLTDKIKIETKIISRSKTTKSESTHESATAKGDLSVTQRDLDEDIKMVQELHIECMSFASDFEMAVKSRAEELKALAAAKKIIEDQTGGAESAVYDSSLSQVSFAQVASSSSRSRLTSGLGLANFEVVRFVRDIARKQHSPELAQLALRITSVMHAGNGEQHVFDKVMGLIRDLIEKLNAEAAKDATHDSWCKKETSETTAAKDVKSALIEELQTKLDGIKAKSAQLKEQVAMLQHELADLAKSQAEMDAMRIEEKTNFASTKGDLEQGIAGVKLALKVLSKYYGKRDEGSAQGAGSGIIAMIEVVEADFTKALEELTMQEATAQRAYDEQTRENEAARETKQKEVKYNTKEYLHMDQYAKEIESDLSNVQTELDAILKALAKINDMCIARVEPYAERTRRREEEMAGLKQALEILEGEAVLLQKKAKHARWHGKRSLRGGELAVAAGVAV